MGYIIGQSVGVTQTPVIYSTWGKVRCPLIGDFDKFESSLGPGAYAHNLTIEAGFHPEEGFFLRAEQWPYQYEWFDVDGFPHTSYNGPINGYQAGGYPAGYDSFFSIGSYDHVTNQSSNPTYTSVNNLLDFDDIQNALVGLTATYAAGTFTTDEDAFDNAPPTEPYFGQNLSLVDMSQVTAISSFTSF